MAGSNATEFYLLAELTPPTGSDLDSSLTTNQNETNSFHEPDLNRNNEHCDLGTKGHLRFVSARASIKASTSKGVSNQFNLQTDV